MPTYRHVDVHVTDANDQPLTEWGIRKHDRSRTSTCYIQSENDKAFRIHLRPMSHLVDFEVETLRELDEQYMELGGASTEGESSLQFDTAGGSSAGDKGKGVAKFPPQYDGAYDDGLDEKMGDDGEASAGGYGDEMERETRATGSGYRVMTEEQDGKIKIPLRGLKSSKVMHKESTGLWGIGRSADVKKEANMYTEQDENVAPTDNTTEGNRPAGRRSTRQYWRNAYDESESPTPKRGRRHRRLSRTPSMSPPPHWHLLATLRLDGRYTPEKRIIIYLDEDHPNFERPDGKVIMKFGRHQDEDRNVRECGWYFGEVGVEVAFNQLLVSSRAGGNQAAELSGEDELVNAFGKLGPNEMEDSEKRPIVGQIKITLERVMLCKVLDDWEPEKKRTFEAKPAKVGISDLTKVSHTAARDTGTISTRKVSTIEYEYIDHYATFEFYYRSEDCLRKFDFPGFPPKTASVNTIRQRKDALFQLAATPLSILNNLTKSSKSIDAANAHETLHPGAAVGDEADGISPNLPDQGLGEGMKKLHIGSKRSNDDVDGEVEEEIEGAENPGRMEIAAVGQVAEKLSLTTKRPKL